MRRRSKMLMMALAAGPTIALLIIIKDDRLEVGLWFKGRYARVVVPFDAVTGFWDNTVKIC